MNKSKTDSAIIEENEKLKKSNAQKLKPKLLEALLNIINNDKNKLYLHLYIPGYDKFESNESLTAIGKSEKFVCL